MRTSSAITYRPLGLRSASTGTRWPMRVKSSSASLHAGGVRDRQQVQHGVGRAAERDDRGDRVLERLAREDVARPDALLEQVARPPRRRARSRRASRGEIAACAELFGRLSPSASIADAIVLAVYMPPHEPGARAGVRLEIGEIGVAELPRGVLPHGLEHRHDVDGLVAPRARQDRAAVDEHRRAIEPRHRHHAARHVLVAAADRHEAVEPLGADHGLDRVGDHLARHERVLHALGAHRDAVGHGDGVEDHGLAARLRWRPSAACRASSSMCTLHGVTWLQVEQMPICGLAKSSRVKPTACSIARPGARSGPSRTFEECGRWYVMSGHSYMVMTTDGSPDACCDWAFDALLLLPELTPRSGLLFARHDSGVAVQI